jgi:uncharacterized protein YjbI with pentapeptide repeats
MVDGQFPAMARVNYTPLGKIRESSIIIVPKNNGSPLKEIKLTNIMVTAQDVDLLGDILKQSIKGGISVNLSYSSLMNLKLSGTDFSQCNLSYCRIQGTDLSECNLSNVNLSHSNLRGVNMSNTNCQGTNFWEANLRNTNRTDSNITRRQLQEAYHR